MRRLTIYAMAAAISVALGTAAYAQSRHDEKPHGMGKPAAAQDTSVTDRTPGRHDERPHGPSKSKKKAAKGADAKKGDDAK